MRANEQRTLSLRWMAALAVLAALLASLVPVLVAGAQGGGARLDVLTPVLNVRSGPGANYPVIDTLRQGTGVDVLGRNKGSAWWQVQLPGGQLGWVSGAAGLVQVSGATDDLPAVAAPPAPAVSVAGAETGPTPGRGRIMVFQAASGGPIYVINSDGTGMRKLTTGIDPVLSPDGSRVAFTRWDSSTIGTPGQLWVINVDGTGERMVAEVRQAKSPTWSPDGKQIVVNMQKGGTLDARRASGAPTPDAEDIDEIRDEHGKLVGFRFTIPADPWWYLRVINVADGSYTDLPSDNHAFTPAWNPTTDRHVVYHGRKGLQSMDVKRDANWQLTGEPGDRAPAFSPDGKRLAVAYRQHDHTEIHVVDLATGTRTRLTETPYNVMAEQLLKGEPVRQWNNTAPVWSPDGTQIAFLTDRTGKWEFWVMNADGSGQRPLFPAGALQGIDLKFNGMDERVLSWR